MEPIVERVVGQVLESHAVQLRTEIARRVMEEIAAESGGHTHNSVPASSPADLARAVAEIQLGSSQREILRALLDSSARHASRVALFVVKGSHATGWEARGFAHNDAVKDFALDENAHAVVRAMGRAMGDRTAASAPAADLDPRFLQQFGTPASGEGRILPLILKDKVAALVYADSGTSADGSLDAGAIELLVLSTSAWLEVNSLRKQAHKDPASHDGASHGVPAAEAPSYQAPHTAPAFNDPFAVHAPGHAMAAAASAGEVSAPVIGTAVEAPIPTQIAEVIEAPIASAEVQFEVQSAFVEMGSAPVDPAPAASISPDQDVHRKALRFARLLVDEIKLYNPAKVAEGRKNKDLYDRLQEEIEKSRATYQKRYGNTIAASANYFQHEIIRSLAEDDLSVMGANFRH